MSARAGKWLRSIGGGIVVVAIVVGVAAAGMPRVHDWLKPTASSEVSAVRSEGPQAALTNNSSSLLLPPEIQKKLGIQTVTVTRPATGPQIRLDGSTGLDPDWTHWARARFSGELVYIASVPTLERDADGKTKTRPLSADDFVEEGQLLAVVWSKDLGEKKSELIDALSQLRLDTETLERQEELYKKGGVPIRTLEETRRRVEGDRIAVARAERTLRVWRVSDDEMKQIRDEAKRLFERRLLPADARSTLDQPENDWARVELRAPFSGMVLERNVGPHDIVDTSTVIFKIAKMDRLLIQANAYEESLPALLSLAPEKRRWQVRLKADPAAQPMDGSIKHIRHVLDPATQTVFVVGYVDNSKGLLRSGQFVTATVTLPVPEGVVSIPATALVEDGWQSTVFVQLNPPRLEYTMLRVQVTQRFQDHVLVRSELTPEAQRLSPQDEKLGLLPFSPLPEGALVVASGSVELKAELAEQMSKAKK
jgi:cobalt-zinc-cadmium efflux system membrane fusion protein